MYKKGCCYLLLPLVVGLSGCGTYQPVVGSNHSAEVGFVRVGTERGGASPWRAELSLAKTRGDFSQRLQQGEHVSLGDGVYSGPAIYHGNAEITFGTGSVMFQSFREDGLFGTELGFGLVHATADIEYESSRDTEAGLGFGVGGALLLREPGGMLGLRAGGNVYVGFLADSFSQYELLVTFRPTRHVELLAGWQGFGVHLEDPLVSDIDLSYSGPSLGLRVIF